VEGIVMKNKFIMNSSSWDYANLAKSAAKHGGPQKYVNTIYKAGLEADIANARLLSATVGVIAGFTIGALVGIVVYPVALKWLSSKRKRKNEELILQQEFDIDENLDVETGADL
jgi:hypothetical protein